jgi:SpoVK/Ycf46/Vps4 family AAA+-type ATPase
VGEEDTYADVIRVTRPEEIPTDYLRQYTIEEYAREFHKLVSNHSKVSHELKEFGIPFGGRALLVGPPGTDFETFANHLAIEMPINLIRFKLSELLGKKLDMSDIIRVGFETALRHSPSLLYLERLDMLAAMGTQESVVIYDELREISWDNNETLVVSSVHNLSSVDKEVLSIFNLVYEIKAASTEDRIKVFERVLQTRNDLDIGILTDLTEGWSFTDVKHLAVNLYMSPPNDSGKANREQMEQMIEQCRIIPIHTISPLKSVVGRTASFVSQDIEAADKMYPDEFIDQLYLMAVGEDYTQTQRVIETLNANLPLSNDEREFLSRHPFILTGSSEDRLSRLLKAKRSNDRLKRIMGR